MLANLFERESSRQDFAQQWQEQPESFLQRESRWDPELVTACGEWFTQQNAQTLGVGVDEVQRRLVPGEEGWWWERLQQAEVYNQLQWGPRSYRRWEEPKHDVGNKVDLVVSPYFPLHFMLMRKPGGKTFFITSLEKDNNDLYFTANPPEVRQVIIDPGTINLYPHALYFDLDGTTRPKEEERMRNNFSLPIRPETKRMLQIIGKSNFELNGWTGNMGQFFERWRSLHGIPFQDVWRDFPWSAGRWITPESKQGAAEYLRQNILSSPADRQQAVQTYVSLLSGREMSVEDCAKFISQQFEEGGIYNYSFYTRVPELYALYDIILMSDEEKERDDKNRVDLLNGTRQAVVFMDDAYLPGTVRFGGNSVVSLFPNIENVPSMLFMLQASHQLQRNNRV